LSERRSSFSFELPQHGAGVVLPAGRQEAVAEAEVEAEEEAGLQGPQAGERRRRRERRRRKGEEEEEEREEVEGARGTVGTVRLNSSTPPGSSNGRESEASGVPRTSLDSDAGTQLRASNSQQDARMEALLTARWQETQEHAMWPAGMSLDGRRH